LVVFEYLNLVLFFISVAPSEVRRFEFKVSWLGDNHIATVTFVSIGPWKSAQNSPSRRWVGGLQFSNVDMILISPREQVGDSRVSRQIANGVSFRSKKPINVSNVPSSHFFNDSHRSELN
jgi:hypothetical protein